MRVTSLAHVLIKTECMWPLLDVTSAHTQKKYVSSTILILNSFKKCNVGAYHDPGQCGH